MPKRIGFSYYPWIKQHTSPADLAKATAEFVELLNAHLKDKQGNQFQIDTPISYEVPQQLDYMRAPPQGDLAGKVGLLNPLGYALLRSENPGLEAIAVVLRKNAQGVVGPTYNAQLYRRSDSTIKTLQDVRGRTVAFGISQSTSNFLVPAGMLLSQKMHPLTAMSKIQFAGGHPEAAIAVYKGQADVGAGHDGVIANLAGKPGFEDAEKVLVNLAWSPPIPSDPVVVHTSDPALRTQVTRALLEVAKPGQQTSKANLAVERFWGTTEGFESIAPDAYSGLLDIMGKLGLKLPDVMR